MRGIGGTYTVLRTAAASAAPDVPAMSRFSDRSECAHPSTTNSGRLWPVVRAPDVPGVACSDYNQYTAYQVHDVTTPVRRVFANVLHWTMDMMQ